MKTTIYLCEDSIEGIFSGIYQAWDDGPDHTDVRVNQYETISLLEDYKDAVTDLSMADKVARTIVSKLSQDAYYQIYLACLSDSEDKASCIYHFLQTGFKKGPDYINALQDPYVHRLFEITRAVSNEACRYREFIRFEELENGVLTGRIAPKYNIVPIIADYFSDRLFNENWIILDTSRSFAALHTANKGYMFTNISPDQVEQFSDLSKKEKEFQALWRQFYTSIAIEERRNYALQRNLLPKRCRTYMTEFLG